MLAVGLTLTWAAAEHASAGIQVPVAMVSSVLHLLAMSVWLGGLAALLTLLQAAEPLPASTVARFSRLAFISVAVLTVTGVYQSWRGLGSWDAFTGTSYGRILIAKLCAVALLLARPGSRAAGRAGCCCRRRRMRWWRSGGGGGAQAVAEAKVAERVAERVGGPATPVGGESDGGARGRRTPGQHASLLLPLRRLLRRLSSSAAPFRCWPKWPSGSRCW